MERRGSLHPIRRITVTQADVVSLAGTTQENQRDVTSAHVNRVILFVTAALHTVTAELQLVMREHLSL